MEQIYKKKEDPLQDLANENTAATLAATLENKLTFNKENIRQATDEEEKQNQNHLKYIQELGLHEIWLVAYANGYDLV